MSSDLERQLLGFSTLVHLEQRARSAADPEELGFIVANESHNLVHYRQAVLWSLEGGRLAAPMALSGVGVPDPRTPYAQWLERLAAHLPRTPGLHPVTPEALPAEVAAGWSEWLPQYALLLLLSPPGAPPQGALLVTRDTPFSEGEQGLLRHLGEAYGHAWHRLRLAARKRRHTLRAWLTGPRRRWVTVALAVALLLLPVRLSVLAPAEVTPLDPVVVRAPLEGVVYAFQVTPNQRVTAGQPLFSLDPRRLQNKLEVARQVLETTRAEYRQAIQQAVLDQRSKGRLALLKGRMEENDSEVRYLEGLLERIQVRAERDGVAVFSDPSAWLGRPLALGEGVMLLADPESAELVAHVAAADAIPLPPEAPVSLFLTTDPVNPVAARLHTVGYLAEPTPEGGMAYRVTARFEPGRPPPRIGLRGTAKLHGERVTLAYYLFRRPWAVIRQFLGW